MTGQARRMNAPPGVRSDYPLERLTTVRTGGSGDFFARPGSLDALLELLRWADAEGIEVGVVGSGSNLLISDLGFRGLVLKLDEDLATIEQQGERLVCGGGARLPQAAAQSARAGLSGLEFGVNISRPGGGAGTVHAHAHGGRRKDEPQRLGRRSLERPRVGAGVYPRRLGAARARGPRLPLPPLEPE